MKNSFDGKKLQLSSDEPGNIECANNVKIAREKSAKNICVLTREGGKLYDRSYITIGIHERSCVRHYGTQDN